MPDFATELANLRPSKQWELYKLKELAQIMSEMEKQVNPQSDSMQLFEKSVEVGLKVAAPYKVIIGWLVATLIASNLIWGGVHFYHIMKSYEPEEIEITQTQDMPNQTQEQAQTTRGVS